MINRVSDFAEQEAKQNFDKQARAVQSRLSLPQVDSFAKQHPAAVMAIGAAVGICIGWWVKRK